MFFENFFIHFRINKIIKLLDEHNGTLSRDSLDLIRGKEYRNAISALEDSGCIKVIRVGDGIIAMIVTTHKGFSVYCLERHDVWINRIIGFVTGVAFTVIADLIKNALL